MAGYMRKICAAVLAALVAACVPATVAPSASATASSPRASDVPTCGDGRELHISGQVLDTFNPAKPGQTGAPDFINISIPDSITADFNAAFFAAPDYLKTLLCGLAGIYITSTTPGLPSWGYRDTNAPQNRYIALSRTAIWPTTGFGARPLNEYQTATINALLPKLQNSPVSVRYEAAKFNGNLFPTPDGKTTDGPITVLAVMAHEVGHILWLDKLVARPGSNPDFTQFCVNGNVRLPQDFWTASPFALRWQEFGLVNDYPQEFPDPSTFMSASDDPPAADARIGKLKARLDIADNTKKPKDYEKARRIIARILAEARPWPSLFGAFSVNEQFVETFTLYTLLKATPGLTSLPLLIPDGNPAKQDIPATLGNRTSLKNMLACFDRYFPRH